MRTTTLLILFTFGLVLHLMGQSVSGTLTDAQSKETLPGVNILVKGTSTGTSTDAKGQYELTVESLQDTLVVSYIGYKTQEIPIQERTAIDIVLQPQAIAGEEMVVIGYGEQKKKDLTGSVSSINSDDFKEEGTVHTSVDQLISNSVPGVNVTQQGSQPGTGSSVSIRGASSIQGDTNPLYVIDGLPINKSTPADATGKGFANRPGGRNPLNSINPEDIESVQVLKDASATAIYGARGANGVILITTRKGGKNEFRVNYSGYTTMQSVENKLEVLNAVNYKNILNNIISQGGGSESNRVSDFEGQGTNWQDLIYQDIAPITNHKLTFSGGSDNTTYYASLNYFDQDGIIKNSGMKRYSARINLESNLSEKFNIKLNISPSYINDNYVAFGHGINEHGGVIQSAINMDPTLQPFDDNGDYVISDFIQMDNPISILNDKRSIANEYRTYGTVQATYDFLPYLNARVRTGGDFNYRQRDTYVGTSTQEGAALNGVASTQKGLSSNYLFEGTLNFNKSFGISSIDALAGFTYQRFLTSSNYMTGNDFPTAQTFTNNMELANKEDSRINSNKTSHKLASYIGRANYSLMDKYLITGTVRADGSSRFGKDNRFGFFPSLAIGWRINEEPFLQNIETISNLKLRASWGKTGNQGIGNLNFMSTFQPASSAVFNNEFSNTLEPTRLANPSLRWETTSQIDVGIDFGFFRGRLSGIIDYYQKKTTDLLVNIPVPTSTGYSSRLENIGEMSNNGFEISIETRNITSNVFNWQTKGNISFQENEVGRLGSNIDNIIISGPGQTGQSAIIRSGATLRSFYGYEIEGIWQDGGNYSDAPDGAHPGALKYKDINDDGKINAEDRTILGNSVPDAKWSFMNSLNYKNLNLNFSFDGTIGVQMLNVNMIDSFFPTGFRRNKIAKIYKNRWTPDNPSNKWPSFVDPLSQGQRNVNSYTVQDASYIRLKTIRLAYNIPITSIRKLSIYGAVDNVFTIDDYIGPDPTVSPNNQVGFRVDWNGTPMVRSYTIGVNLTF